ncbi:MAG: hypothetical protein OXN84_14130 [Albidovulum sp.]|nr:hypothetical protein [Albidovulum sp.]
MSDTIQKVPSALELCYWRSVVQILRGTFPCLANEVGPLGERHRRFVAVRDAFSVEPFVGGQCRI